MTADGDDHISPDKLNCLSKSSESQYNPSLLGSHVVLQPCASELVICGEEGGGGGKPQIFREYLTDVKKKFSFSHGWLLFAKRSWCCLRAWNTFSPPQRSYMGSSSSLFPVVFTMKAYPSKHKISKFPIAYLPFVLASDFCLWLHNTAQWCINGWYKKNVQF